MKNIRAEELRAKLNADNAVRLFILSDMHLALKLKESAIWFISRIRSEIVTQTSWQELHESHPHLIDEVFLSTIKC